MAENRELALVLKLVADQFQAELKNSQGALGTFNSFIKDWKTQLTAAGTALFAIAKSAANFGEEALKGAQKTGQTVETFTALSYAAKLADVDQQQLIVGLKSLSQNMVEASRQTGDGEAIFRRLGVSALDAAGKMRPTEQVLLDLAEVFKQSADGAGKTEAAVKLFGKAGVDLIPFLNQGKAGITELMAEAQRLGVVLSKEDAEAANKFNDEIKRLESSLRGLTLQLGNALLPVMTDGLDLFTQMIAKTKEFGSETSTVAQNLKNMSDAFGQTKMGQGMMDTFTALGFGHRKGEGTLPREQFLFDLLKSVGGLQGQTPGSGVLALPGQERPDKPQMGQIADQEKLGKALLEIYLARNRAIDIQNKLNAEGSNQYFLAFDRKEQFQKEDEARQEQLGKMIVDQTKLEVQIRDEALAKERDGLIANLQAWVSYDEQVGASTEQRYAHQLDLLRATLAKQTDLTTDETGRLLIAWQNHDDELAQQILARTTLTAQQKETIEIQALTKVAQANDQASDDIFAGWSRGMARYVQDTQSGFGLGADMARRTAQAMEQGFRTFFFDLFEGRIKTFKDALRGMLDFAKQIIAQIAAQLAVKSVMSLFAFSSPIGGLAGPPGNVGGFELRNSGGMILPRRFDIGGTVLGTGNRDTVSALLTPGEFVVNRRGVAALERLNHGQLGGSGVGNITVNVIDSGNREKPTVDIRRQFDGMVIDVIFRNVQANGPLRALMGA